MGWLRLLPVALRRSESFTTKFPTVFQTPPYSSVQASRGNIALGYIATILAIFTAYIRAAGKIAGAPNEFCGPMAKQHRMLVITLICLYSAITPRSWQMITFNDSQIGLMSLGLVVIVVGCVITVIRRVSRITQALK